MKRVLNRLDKLERRITTKNMGSATWTVVCGGRAIQQSSIQSKKFGGVGNVTVMLPNDFWEDSYENAPHYEQRYGGQTNLYCQERCRVKSVHSRLERLETIVKERTGGAKLIITDLAEYEAVGGDIRKLKGTSIPGKESIVIIDDVEEDGE